MSKGRLLKRISQSTDSLKVLIIKVLLLNESIWEKHYLNNKFSKCMLKLRGGNQYNGPVLSSKVLTVRFWKYWCYFGRLYLDFWMMMTKQTKLCLNILIHGSTDSYSCQSMVNQSKWIMLTSWEYLYFWKKIKGVICIFLSIFLLISWFYFT